MKPKPLVSLKHFTVPVVRIAEPLKCCAQSEHGGPVSTACRREWSPHAGAALSPRHCVAAVATLGKCKRDPRCAGPFRRNSNPEQKHGVRRWQNSNACPASAIAPSADQAPAPTSAACSSFSVTVAGVGAVVPFV